MTRSQRQDVFNQALIDIDEWKNDLRNQSCRAFPCGSRFLNASKRLFLYGYLVHPDEPNLLRQKLYSSLPEATTNRSNVSTDIFQQIGCGQRTFSHVKLRDHPWFR